MGTADPPVLRLFQSVFRQGRIWGFLAGLADSAARRTDGRVVSCGHRRRLKRLSHDAGRVYSASGSGLHYRRGTAAARRVVGAHRRGAAARARHRNAGAGRRACRRTSSVFPAPLSPMRRMPARCFWCSTISRSAATILGNRRRRSRRSCSGGCPSIQDAFIIRGATAAGHGYRHRRRLSHDGRGSRRARLGSVALGD